MSDSNPARLVLVLLTIAALGFWGGINVFSQAAGRSVIIPRGTKMEVALLQGLSTKYSQEGEQFAAVLEKDLVLEGLTLIPKGSRVFGTVSRVKRPGRFRGKAELSFCFDFIRFPGGREEPIVATISRVDRLEHDKGAVSPEGEMQGRGSRSRDAGMVITGGAAGAGIGALAGGGKGAAIGGAAGSLLGLAGVFWTRGEEIQLPARTLIELILEKPLTASIATSPIPGERPPWK